MSAATLTPADRVRRAGRGTVRLLRDIAGSGPGLLSLILLALLLVVIVAAPWLAPYDPATQNIAERLSGPSTQHPLGTDHLGRDLLSRALYGARIALGVAIPAGLLALVVGLLLGLLSGYLGGRTDNVLVVIMDSMQAFPAVILALTLLALLGPSPQSVIIVVAITFAPAYARMARASVFVVREEAYIEAERSLGASDARIVLAHVLPNIIAPLFILTAINVPLAVTIEAGLSFLGLGVPPPEPSWGVMLDDGFRRVRETPWPVIVPGVALIVTTLAFTLFGEALRDRLDPRLSGADGGPGV
jgi:peptide/nickel transport system permease protein